MPYAVSRGRVGRKKRTLGQCCGRRIRRKAKPTRPQAQKRKRMEVFETADGSHSIFSAQYGVSYHSKYGAIQETQHVFINAGLRLKAIVQSDIRILDIGFGTGLNALMTALEAQKRNLSIDYTAVEAFPVSAAIAAGLNYPEVLPDEPDAAELLEALHAAPWGGRVAITPDFMLEKLHCTFQELALPAVYDLVYFDAFAPTAQPELWTEEVLGIMYRALKPDGVLTTYCAKGEVKRTLKRLGFKVERLPGPPGKREMTRAVKIVA